MGRDAPREPAPAHHWGRWITILVLAVFVGAGLSGLNDAVGWPAPAIAAGILATCLLWRWLRHLLYWPGVVVIPIVALIGFNVAWDWLGLPRIDLLPGLAVAIAVFASGAIIYLHLREPVPVAALVGIPLATLFVLVVPSVASRIIAGDHKVWGPLAVAVFVVAAIVYIRLRGSVPAAAFFGIPLAIVLVLIVPSVAGTAFVDQHKVSAAQLPIASKLDLMIVVAAPGGGAQAGIEPTSAPLAWDIHYSVARAKGRNLRWALLDSEDPAAATSAAGGSGGFVAGSPTLRDGADRALLLIIDGTPPVVADPSALPNVARAPGEIARWREIARAAAPPGTPTFALLQTTDPSRLARWDRWLGRRGGALSIQKSGSQVVTDTALHAATEAPTAREDMALAMKYRPVLLFDGREPVDTPLDIGSFFATGRVELCREQAIATPCETVRDSSQLINGATHLRIDLPRPRIPSHDRTPVSPEQVAGAAPPGPTANTTSTIYVHAVPVTSGGQKLVYLDYWWYLPYNPAGTASGASCRVGLAIPGVTCFDHQSDWEGVTVVVDRTNEPALVAVQYAEHSDVVRYPWDYLRGIWQGSAYAPFTSGIEDAEHRPLVFVARGSHASYATPCTQACHQVAAALTDNARRGNDPWPGNYTPACTAAACLKPLPTRNHGAEPALWNAFEGTWGERHCILVYVCDADNAPVAPANQNRYKHPWQISGTVDARGHFVPAG